MKFSKYIEESLVLDVSDLCFFTYSREESGFFGYYLNSEIATNAIHNEDEDEFQKQIVGGGEFEINYDDDDGYYTLMNIGASRENEEKRYGVLMYLTLMQLAKDNNLLGASPSGNIRPDAKAVWEKFYNDGKGNEFATPVKKLSDSYLDYIYQITDTGKVDLVTPSDNHKNNMIDNENKEIMITNAFYGYINSRLKTTETRNPRGQ